MNNYSKQPSIKNSVKCQSSKNNGGKLFGTNLINNSQNIALNKTTEIAIYNITPASAGVD